jgi:hypothetical protein
LQHQIDTRGVRDFELRPTFTQLGDKIIGSSLWLDADGDRTERYQVLTIRDGKIADMQVCGTWRQAKRFAKRTLR